MKYKIVITSHCIFNDAAKLMNQNIQEQANEKMLKKELVCKLLEQNVEFVQLPCPEFVLYGSKRWGHATSQFDHPYFRKACREMLEPYLMQIEEYIAHPETFEIVGVIGINGSPSCGVDCTYDGAWGGEFSSNDNLPEMLQGIKREERSGVLISVLKEMLQERKMEIPFYSYETFPI